MRIVALEVESLLQRLFSILILMLILIFITGRITPSEADNAALALCKLCAVPEEDYASYYCSAEERETTGIPEGETTGIPEVACGYFSSLGDVSSRPITLTGRGGGESGGEGKESEGGGEGGEGVGGEGVGVFFSFHNWLGLLPASPGIGSLPAESLSRLTSSVSGLRSNPNLDSNPNPNPNLDSVSGLRSPWGLTHTLTLILTLTLTLTLTAKPYPNPNP